MASGYCWTDFIVAGFRLRSRELPFNIFSRMRKFRRSRRYRRRARSGYFRRRATKALRIVRAISRKVAAEVKKADSVALIQASDYQMVLGDSGNAALVTLRDYGHVYNVFGSGDVQGI